MVEWIAAQPWCNGKVGMMGPSSYSVYQIHAGLMKPPHLVALHPDENLRRLGRLFQGHLRPALCITYSWADTETTALFPPRTTISRRCRPSFLNLPDIKERLEEALNHPDIKYNSKWYSYLRYPRKFPILLRQPPVVLPSQT